MVWESKYNTDIGKQFPYLFIYLFIIWGGGGGGGGGEDNEWIKIKNWASHFSFAPAFLPCK